jgi:hypothetical protein
MIFHNYRALVTAEAAKEWFAITPESVQQAKKREAVRAVDGRRWAGSRDQRSEVGGLGR